MLGNSAERHAKTTDAARDVLRILTTVYCFLTIKWHMLTGIHFFLTGLTVGKLPSGAEMGKKTYR